MIVFNDNYYYIIAEDVKFLKDFVENTRTSSIFCQDDITSFSDAEYRFTLWPDKPLDKAMQICHDHGMWNGLTASLIKKDFVELWWFTGDGGSRDFYTRNKDVLVKFIHYFNCQKQKLLINAQMNKLNSFRFKDGFYIKNNNSKLDNEKVKIRSFLTEIKSRNFTLQTKYGEVTFSPKEIQILSLLSSGFTTELAATHMNVAAATARGYIEDIKMKLHQSKKIHLVNLYLNNFKKFFE